MLCFVFAALVVLLDQLFKRWVVITLMLGEETVVIRGIVNLLRVENKGAAFSILPEQRWLLAAISFVAAIVLIAILLRYNEGFWGTLGLASVLGGAVGNLIDRVFNGYVVDMFRFTFMEFAIFNIADIFITLGMITFCIFFIVTSFRSGGNKEDAPAPEADEYGSSDIEQYDRKNYQHEPVQEPEDVDYNKLFYGDPVSEAYPDAGFTPPEDFDSAPEQFTTIPDYFDSAPEQFSLPPEYFDSAPGQNGFYPSAQEPPEYNKHVPEQYVHNVAVQEPPGDATTTLDAMSSLGALSALESELNETDLLASYDIDEILREYGFEDGEN